jgi:hypothetical protein
MNEQRAFAEDSASPVLNDKRRCCYEAPLLSASAKGLGATPWTDSPSALTPFANTSDFPRITKTSSDIPAGSTCDRRIRRAFVPISNSGGSAQSTP